MGESDGKLKAEVLCHLFLLIFLDENEEEMKVVEIRIANSSACLSEGK